LTAVQAQQRQTIMWQDIIKTSLIGTDKCTPSVSTLEKLNEMGVKAEDVSEIVLKGAGMLSLMRKGGYPLTDFRGTLPELCETERALVCSNKSGSHLKAILYGDYEEALEEFLLLLKTHNVILPAQFLPKLFHYCRGNQVLWAMVEPVIGQKGQWLLQQNEDWSHLAKMPKNTINTDGKSTSNKITIQNSEGCVFQQLTNEETLKEAREIVAVLNTNRFVWVDDRKINMELKGFAYKANTDLIDNLNHYFATELAQSMTSKVQGVLKILFFRQEMKKAFQS
jgi:hypothetical protein